MTRSARSAVVLSIIVLVAMAVLLAARGIILDARRGSADDPSALQAYAAAASTLGTAALIGVTAVYVQLTAGILQHAGPIITVELLHAWMQPGGVAVVTAPLTGSPTQACPEPSYSVHYFAARLRNSGNGSVTVDSIDFDLDKFSIGWIGTPGFGPSCPCRLEPHSRETFYIDERLIVDGLAVAAQKKPRLRARAYLASGATASSDWATLS